MAPRRRKAPGLSTPTRARDASDGSRLLLGEGRACHE